MTPPRPILRIVWAVHKAIFRITNGRVGAQRPGKRVGTLFLLATGHKSGVPRRNGLYYIEDGPNFVVVASNAGDNVDPAWWRNLQAKPEAEVDLGTRRVPVRARAATPLETARLWLPLEAANPDYATYRQQATRDIPVVILEPR